MNTAANTSSSLSAKRKTRLTFFGINGLVIVVSLVMIGIFSRMISIKDSVDYTDKDVIAKMSGSFIAVSLMMIISTLLGISGVQFKKPQLIIVYLVILVICCALVLIFEVMSFAYKNGDDNIDAWTNEECVSLWNVSSYDVKEMIREQLNCCFFNSSYENISDTNYTSDITLAHCDFYNYNSSAYCSDVMAEFVKEYIMYLEMFGFLFTGVLISLFSIAMALCNNYRKKTIETKVVSNRGTRTVGVTKFR